LIISRTEQQKQLNLDFVTLTKLGVEQGTLPLVKKQLSCFLVEGNFILLFADFDVVKRGNYICFTNEDSPKAGLLQQQSSFSSG